MILMHFRFCDKAIETGKKSESPSAGVAWEWVGGLRRILTEASTRGRHWI